jgi:hypothetical protein
MLVILGGFLMAVTLALAGAILQRHRAAAAADLAALAAVDASAGGLLGMPGIGSGGDSVRASTDASTDASASASVADPAGGPEGATAPGSSNGCDEARRVAAANDVQLDVCRWLSDGSVLVGVQAPAASLRLFGLLDLRVRASSRAGPGPS